MKNKKGFTLIELLAIIVILAIIAVITTPIILNIIEKSKKGAAIDSALGYKDAIQKYYASKLLEDSTFKLNGEYDISSIGELTNDLEEYQIAFSGTTPSGGYATIENGKLTSGCVQINEYAVRFNDGKVSETTKGTCGPVIVEEYPQVEDVNPGVICGSGSEEDYNNSTVCYIYSVEDLVAFSNMVNNGKSFENKTVMVMNNLDIKDDKSYIDPSATNFGDINGNSSTETIKEELTNESSKGFPTVGNNTNRFLGTLEGNAKKINNIYINTTENYKGLIGYNGGTIRGIILDNMYVKGNTYLGLVAGQTNGTITDVQATGNIYGTRNIGLLSGNVDAGSVKGIAKGNIESTGGGAAYIGGLAGYQTNGTDVKGVYQGGTIKCVSTAIDCEKSIGQGGGSSTQTVISAASATVNGTATTGTNISSETGYTVSDEGIKNIAVYEKIFDTFIGGNEGDEYYYDYNEDGDIQLYTTTIKPLTITMEGSGTENDPYIINNYKQFKEASYNQSAYYRLNTDIDFENKNPIILSSTAHPFTGNFDGGNHAISNLMIEGYRETGLFGKNQGTIHGLHIENISIKGENYVGLIGYNTGTIYGIWVDGNVKGRYYVGLLIGYNTGSATNVQVTGNIKGMQYIGLLVGYTDSGIIKGIAKGDVEQSNAGIATTGGLAGYVANNNVAELYGVYQGGTIKCQYEPDCNKSFGWAYNSKIKATAAASAKVRGVATTSTSLTSTTGYTYSDTDLQTSQTPYTAVGLSFDNTQPYYYAIESNGVNLKSN